MTFKRAVQSCIKMMPKVDGASYLAFKAKSGEYMKKMFTLPVEPPKIDWSAYKNKIPVPPGLVDYFKKSYDAFKRPHPKDVHYADFDGREKENTEEIEQFKVKSDDAAHVKPKSTVDLEKTPSVGHTADIDGREKEKTKVKVREQSICEIAQMLPFAIITSENAAHVKPKSTTDLEKTPSVGPHKEIDYINKPKDEKDERDEKHNKCDGQQDKCDEEKKVDTAPTAPNLK